MYNIRSVLAVIYNVNEMASVRILDAQILLTKLNSQMYVKFVGNNSSRRLFDHDDVV